MILSKINDNRNKHRECFLLVGLKDIQEVIIFEEAHCSIGHLQMNATNALDNSFEKPRNEVFNLVHLTDLENLLKFSQEESLLDTVGEGPELKKSLEKRNSQSPILGEE